MLLRPALRRIPPSLLSSSFSSSSCPSPLLPLLRPSSRSPLFASPLSPFSSSSSSGLISCASFLQPGVSRSFSSKSTEKKAKEKEKEKEKGKEREDDQPKSWLQTFVAYARLGVAGTKQITFESGSALKIILTGGPQNRKDTILLRRSKNDLIALIPFAILIILPGSFLTFPIVFAYFPSLIPSVYRTKPMQAMIDGKPEKKLEIMAAFGQDLLLHMDHLEKHHQDLAIQKLCKELKSKLQDGLNKSKTTGVTFEEILSLEDVARLFPFEKFSDSQVKRMLYFMGKPSFFFPHRKLRDELRFIRKDDEDIRKEGLNTLTDEEVREALKDRAFQSYLLEHASSENLRKLLGRWNEFSLAAHGKAEFLLPLAMMLRAK